MIYGYTLFMRFLHIEVRMRTNIEIDDKLMSDAMESSGALTKKAAVEEGLRLLTQIKRQGAIRELRGKIEFYDDVLAERELSRIE
jgi:Arc/MetJ family transcription regulator